MSSCRPSRRPRRPSVADSSIVLPPALKMFREAVNAVMANVPSFDADHQIVLMCDALRRPLAAATRPADTSALIPDFTDLVETMEGSEVCTFVVATVRSKACGGPIPLDADTLAELRFVAWCYGMYLLDWIIIEPVTPTRSMAYSVAGTVGAVNYWLCEHQCDS
jgi:hypothetical protein